MLPDDQCKHSHALIIGGVDTNGTLSNLVYGVQFVEEKEGLPQLRMSHSNQREYLPAARFMHQSCIVQYQGKARLLVVGGKLG